MSSRTALPSSRKTHSEKHKLILRQLLRENDNRSCADCKTAKNPRWASWTLGCFICIRCLGIHRSMGTHISKVKSVDLDAWQDHEIESMVKWGNKKSNWYWESKLPENYLPNELKIDNFIRTKYESKKWVGSTRIPDPMSIEVTGETNTTTTTTAAITTPTIASQPPKSKPQETITSSLLDEDFGGFSSLSSAISSQHQLRLSASQSPPISIPNPALKSSTYKLPPAVSSPLQSAQSTGGSMSSNGGGGRPDLKKSILSLYSSPASSSSVAPGASPGQAPVQPNRPLTGQGSFGTNAMAHSLLNLELSQNYGQPPNTAGAYTTLPPQMANVWLNVSSTSSSRTSSAAANPRANVSNLTGLDDDLFKNVWS